jgi:hypothetical protein
MSASPSDPREAERLAAHIDRLDAIEDDCYFLAGDLTRAGLGHLAGSAEYIGERVAMERERLKPSKRAGHD